MAGDCPVCLEELNAPGVVSLGCGHVLHAACAAACALCPLCRAAIDADRIKDAEDVPAARAGATPSGGFVGYALRSAQPGPPPYATARPSGLLARPSPTSRMAPARRTRRAERIDASDVPPASSLPVEDLQDLLEGLAFQLDLDTAAASAATPMPAAHPDHPPNTWAFCLDISGECCLNVF